MASTAPSVPRASLLEPERRPQAGHRVRLAAPHLGGAQDREHQVDPRLAVGRVAEHVQPVADLGVLDLAQPAVDVQHEVVERLVVRLLLEAEVAVHLGGVHQLPDLAADGRQLGRVHRRDVGVLVEQLLEPGDVAVRLRAGHRRDQVVDDRGVRAALGLRALAGVVDEERVDQRQAADRRIVPVIAEGAIEGAADLARDAQGAAVGVGMNTISKSWPSGVRSSHLRVPSVDTSSVTISGRPTTNRSASQTRCGLAMSLIAAKSRAPRL